MAVVCKFVTANHLPVVYKPVCLQSEGGRFFSTTNATGAACWFEAKPQLRGEIITGGKVIYTGRIPQKFILTIK